MQILIVGLIVVFALLGMLRRIAPARAWQLQARLSFAFERGAAPGSLRAWIGRRLRPAVAAAIGGCASGGCSSCGGCR